METNTLTDTNNNDNKRAVFNIIISYPEQTKAIVTMAGFNRTTVIEEVKKQFDHIPDLVIETVDLIEGEEANTDNVVDFKPKDQTEDKG